MPNIFFRNLINLLMCEKIALIKRSQAGKKSTNYERLKVDFFFFRLAK